MTAPDRRPAWPTVADREAAWLAPYAFFSAQTRGRRHPEPSHPYRGPFQRDRDRILHSAAYRRLSGKMQVFTGDMGDYHRTRLTHTQEVASIARTIGRALRLNEDLIEALALFHDIGHPPYGHAGEDALHACLAEHGGFSHNRFALTLAEELEQRYPDWPGLNLSREVLDGQLTRVDKSGSSAGDPQPGPLWEVQVVEAADSITYDAHDTDDAVKLGLVNLGELASIPLAREALAAVRERHGPLAGDLLRKTLVHELIDRQVSDVLRAMHGHLASDPPRDWQAAAAQAFRIGPGPELAAQKVELESFLHHQVYRHPGLMTVRRVAQDRLRDMFAGYLRQPELMPERFQLRAEAVGLPRSVGDYLAGMTDRFCEQQYHRHFAGAGSPK